MKYFFPAVLMVFWLVCAGLGEASDFEKREEAKKQLIVTSFPGGWHQEYYSRPDTLGKKEWCRKLTDFLLTYARATTEIGDDFIIVHPHMDLLPQGCFDKQKFKDTNALLLEAPVGLELDLWMRDYTTVDKQNLKHFIYDPKYMRMDGKEDLGSNAVVDSFLGLLNYTGTLNHVEMADMKLDGGNYVDCDDRVILTKRYIEDNNDKDEAKDANSDYWETKLKNLLPGKQLCFFENPPIQSDTTGHSDGLVSFLNRNTVLLPDYDPCDPDHTDYRKREQALKACWSDLKIVRMESYSEKDIKSCSGMRSVNKRAVAGNVKFTEATGSTINLAMTDLGLYVPSFRSVGKNNDATVELIRKNAGGKKIGLVDTGELSHLGGSVRCMSWQMYSDTDAAKAMMSKAKPAAGTDYLSSGEDEYYYHS